MLKYYFLHTQLIKHKINTGKLLKLKEVQNGLRTINKIKDRPSIEGGIVTRVKEQKFACFLLEIEELESCESAFVCYHFNWLKQTATEKDCRNFERNQRAENSIYNMNRQIKESI